MSKSITEETVCFICRDSSQRTMILLSRYCTARGGAAMSYAKKSRHFFTMHIFS